MVDPGSLLELQNVNFVEPIFADGFLSRAIFVDQPTVFGR